MNSINHNIARLVLFMLCVGGAWISAQMVRESAGPWPSSRGEPGLFASLCGAGSGDQSGCTAALKSRWSTVDFSVPVVTRTLAVRWSSVVMPVAFMGLAYFVFLGTWFGLARSPQTWGRRWYAVPLVTILGGVMASIFFVWVMMFKLKSPCMWCLVTHGINALLLVGTLCLWPRNRGPTISATSQSMERDSALATPAMLTLGTALRVVCFALLLIVGLWVYREAKLDTRRQVARLMPYQRYVTRLANDPAFLLREYYAEPQAPVWEPTTDREVADSIVEPAVVIFGDFQCPFSARFADRWRTALQKCWERPPRVVFRHLPLCRDCNNKVSRTMHPEACRASCAAEAARLQGGDAAFWRMHDLLFAHADSLGPQLYAELAEQIGLDRKRFCEDMDSQTVKQTVDADIALAALAGITGTPSVFVNGRRVPPICLQNPVFWKAVAADSKPHPALAARLGSDPEPSQTPNDAIVAGQLDTVP